MTSAANPPAATAKPKAAQRPRAKAAAAPAAAAEEVVSAVPPEEVAPVAEAVVEPVPEVVPEVVVAPAAVAPVAVAAAVTPAPVTPVAEAETPILSVVNAVSVSAQDNLDALVRSGEVLSQGLQDLGRVVLTLTQDSIDDGVALSRRMMEIKTLQEFLEVQSSVVHTQLDRLVSEGTRLGDLSMKLAEAAAQPLSDRFNAVVDRIFNRAA